MAFLKLLEAPPLCHTCNRPAIYMLYTRHHDYLWTYCDRCGEIALENLQRQERVPGSDDGRA